MGAWKDASMEKKLIFTTSSCEDTEKLGQRLARSMRDGGLVAFYGELGAGKTSFIRGMGKIICPDARVCSPTYSIINEYSRDGRTVMYHIDAYRIKDDDDLYSTGYYDLTEIPGCVIAVEWSENIPYALPEECVRVSIEKTEEGGRKITITDPPPGFADT